MIETTRGHPTEGARIDCGGHGAGHLIRCVHIADRWLAELGSGREDDQRRMIRTGADGEEVVHCGPYRADWAGGRHQIELAWSYHLDHLERGEGPADEGRSRGVYRCPASGLLRCTLGPDSSQTEVDA